MSLTRLKAILQITSAKLDEKEDDDFVCDQMKYLIQCFNEHGATTGWFYIFLICIYAHQYANICTHYYVLFEVNSTILQFLSRW